jgi:hypothetical protein
MPTEIPRYQHRKPLAKTDTSEEWTASAHFTKEDSKRQSANGNQQKAFQFAESN